MTMSNSRQFFGKCSKMCPPNPLPAQHVFPRPPAAKGIVVLVVDQPPQRVGQRTDFRLSESVSCEKKMNSSLVVHDEKKCQHGCV